MAQFRINRLIKSGVFGNVTIFIIAINRAHSDFSVLCHFWEVQQCR
jgi:hypothetical protein